MCILDDERRKNNISIIFLNNCLTTQRKQEIEKKEHNSLSLN